MNKFVIQDMEKLKVLKELGYDVQSARKALVSKARLSGRILEVGTGRGHLAVALAKAGYKIISIDTDKRSQQVAKANLKALGLGKFVALKLANAEKLRFKDHYFDSVISANFLHHAFEPLKCVKEMVRVTKDTLVLSDFNKKGERIMDKMHKMERQKHAHPKAKMPLKNLKIHLKRAGMGVKIYRNTFETILVATRSKPV